MKKEFAETSKFRSIPELFEHAECCGVGVIECDKIATCTLRRLLIFFACGQRQAWQGRTL